MIFPRLKNGHGVFASLSGCLRMKIVSSLRITSFRPKSIDALSGRIFVLPIDAAAWKDQGLFSFFPAKFRDALLRYARSRSFAGKSGERVIIPTLEACAPSVVMLVGTGVLDAQDPDVARRLGGTIARIMREQRWTAVDVAVDAFAFYGEEMLVAFIEGLLLGADRFFVYKSKGADHGQEMKEVSLGSCRLMHVLPHVKKSAPSLDRAIARATMFTAATCFARRLINIPSGDMTPRDLAREARALHDPKYGIRCELLTPKMMEKLGMRPTLAVARGSVHPPVGIHLTYAPVKRSSRQSLKTVALVGKAVTFDSGGLSLKPADAMMTMKIDMAGAASVLGVFHALAALQPQLKVHGICLAVENMPGGSAYRPGDVVAAMNGTTIEVLNTDAEGRLTLADALVYAARQKPDAIIDLATLTGACVSALGEDVAGLFTEDASLAEKLLRLGTLTGEPLWLLPLHAPYADLIRSKIADIKNVGGKTGGGAITAALFLKRFVGAIPWAHLDIAGPSYTERETRPDQPYGATGYGVRILLRFLEELARAKM